MPVLSEGHCSQKPVVALEKSVPYAGQDRHGRRELAMPVQVRANKEAEEGRLNCAVNY